MPSENEELKACQSKAERFIEHLEDFLCLGGMDIDDFEGFMVGVAEGLSQRYLKTSDEQDT